MKKQSALVIILLSTILFSCKSNTNTKGHSHDGSEAHSHKTEEATIHQNYFETYTLKDDNFGTQTSVTVKGNNRKMVTNALPNHKTGEFPTKGNPNTISAQSRSYSFPVNPKYTGESKWIRQPGVALNGVKFEPGTAEVVVCDTGENYRVEAFQSLIDLGLDFNNAHVQPTGEYHYHGSPTSVINNTNSEEDLVHIGFAMDGFPIYFSKRGVYKPSYKLLEGTREGEDCTYENPHNSMDISLNDNHDGTYNSDFEFVEGLGDLDECNGINIDGKYMYIVTSEFPYVSRCLMGEFTEEKRGGPAPGQQRGRPTTDQLLNQMDENNDGKLSESEVKGPLKDNFSKFDSNKDGFISKEEIDNGIKRKRPISPKND